MICTDGVHLISTDSLEELHEFAIHKMKFKKEWFQWHTIYPHYDLMTKRAKQRAIEEGAILVEGTEIVRYLKTSPYLIEFWKESTEEYEKDLNHWLSIHFPEATIEDIQRGINQTFVVKGIEKRVTGLYRHRYFKENGFWRSFQNYENKKRRLQKEM